MPRQEGVLVVGRVVNARCQDHDDGVIDAERGRRLERGQHQARRQHVTLRLVHVLGSAISPVVQAHTAELDAQLLRQPRIRPALLTPGDELEGDQKVLGLELH